MISFIDELCKTSDSHTVFCVLSIQANKQIKTLYVNNNLFSIHFYTVYISNFFLVMFLLDTCVNFTQQYMLWEYFYVFIEQSRA